MHRFRRPPGEKLALAGRAPYRGAMGGLLRYLLFVMTLVGLAWASVFVEFRGQTLYETVREAPLQAWWTAAWTRVESALAERMASSGAEDDDGEWADDDQDSGPPLPDLDRALEKPVATADRAERLEQAARKLESGWAAAPATPRTGQPRIDERLSGAQRKNLDDILSKRLEER